MVDEIESKGGQAAAFAADLARLEAPEPLIESCTATLGPITCLINSAACFEWDDIQTLDRDSWQAHLDVNLRAPIFLAQALARRLPKGVSGNVINVIDQKVLRPDPEFFSYTIAKSALWTATQTLAQGSRAADQGQCDCPGPGAAESEADRGGVRARMPRDLAPARREDRGGHGRRSLPARDPLDHRPDDRSRFRPAPCVAEQIRGLRRARP